MLAVRTMRIKANDHKLLICKKFPARSLNPMKNNSKQTPVLRYRNLSAMADKRKNMALSPRMAKMFEKKTT